MYLITAVFIVSSWGCVSKSHFDSVSEQYLQEIEQVQSALAASEKKQHDTQQQLMEAREQARSAFAANEKKQQQLIEIQANLTESEKKIALQKTVIRLFDDSDKTLQKSLEEQLKEQNLAINDEAPPTSLVLLTKLLFDSGSARLREDSKNVLGNLQTVLLEQPYQRIRIQAHTDFIPLRSGAEFSNNWHLSVMRAASVAKYLVDVVGAPPDKIVVDGFGKYQPIADNANEAGRQQNRRIEVCLEK